MSKAWCESASDLYDMLQEWGDEHGHLMRHPEMFARQVTMYVWEELFEREMDDDSEIER